MTLMSTLVALAAIAAPVPKATSDAASPKPAALAPAKRDAAPPVPRAHAAVKPPTLRPAASSGPASAPSSPTPAFGFRVQKGAARPEFAQPRPQLVPTSSVLAPKPVATAPQRSTAARDPLWNQSMSQPRPPLPLPLPPRPQHSVHGPPAQLQHASSNEPTQADVLVPLFKLEKPEAPEQPPLPAEHTVRVQHSQPGSETAPTSARHANEPSQADVLVPIFMTAPQEHTVRIQHMQRPTQPPTMADKVPIAAAVPRDHTVRVQHRTQQPTQADVLVPVEAVEATPQEHTVRVQHGSQRVAEKLAELGWTAQYDFIAGKVFYVDAVTGVKQETLPDILKESF